MLDSQSAGKVLNRSCSVALEAGFSPTRTWHTQARSAPIEVCWLCYRLELKLESRIVRRTTSVSVVRVRLDTRRAQKPRACCVGREFIGLSNIPRRRYLDQGNHGLMRLVRYRIGQSASRSGAQRAAAPLGPAQSPGCVFDDPRGAPRRIYTSAKATWVPAAGMRDTGRQRTTKDTCRVFHSMPAYCSVSNRA